MKKRIFSMLLVVCMVFSSIPISALAVDSSTLPEAGTVQVAAQTQQDSSSDSDGAEQGDTSAPVETPAPTEAPAKAPAEAPAEMQAGGDTSLPAAQNSTPESTPPQQDTSVSSMGLAGAQMAPEDTVPEQFSLTLGQTFYFDLSQDTGTIKNGVSDVIGTINTALPDTTLHYVPFTYVGTVNCYSGADNGTSTPRSLFVADYNVGIAVPWYLLNAYNLIGGKTFDTNYSLRSLSGGSTWINGYVYPTTNEWDTILNKAVLTDPIKNWNGVFSYAQDYYLTNNAPRCVARGNNKADDWSDINSNNNADFFGYRPALEVLNAAALGKEGLKAVALDFNGGALNGASTATVVCAGSAFKAPSGQGLTRPAGNTGTGFYWKGSDNKPYAAGDSVPGSVTGLTAQWSELPVTGKVWNGTSALYFAGGSGTSSAPYQVATAEQLALLADIIGDCKWSNGTGGEGATYGSNFRADRVVVEGQSAQTFETLKQACYQLTADIKLNDTANYQSWSTSAPANSWNPIGAGWKNPSATEKIFKGTFDGNGKTISGVYFSSAVSKTQPDGDAYAGVGLFGYNSGIIKNLTVADSYVEGLFSQATEPASVGGVVGVNKGTVQNCQNTGIVVGHISVGGIVGQNSSQILDCKNTGKIIGTADYTGGIAGASDSKSEVQNCQNSGAVLGKSSLGGIIGQNSGTIQGCQNSGAVMMQDSEFTSIVGGIAGSNAYSCNISNCQNTGPISGQQLIGGIVGFNDGGMLDNCQNGGAVSGIVMAGQRVNNIGGVVGQDAAGRVTNCTSPKGLTKDATGDVGSSIGQNIYYSLIGHIYGYSSSFDPNNSSEGIEMGVAVTPATATIEAGGTQQFAATVGGKSTTEVKWSIVNGDENASIDETGKVAFKDTAIGGTYYAVKALSTTDSTKYAVVVMMVKMPPAVAPKITTTSLKEAKVGDNYEDVIAATGSPTPTIVLTNGALPAGLKLTEDGKITGKPTTADEAGFTVKAVNSSGMDVKIFSIKVKPADVPPEAQWGLAGENGAVPESWTQGSLADAMKYANELTSGTAYIQLLMDIDITSGIWFNNNKTTIFDLNGKTLDAKGKCGSIIWLQGGTFTLTDSSTTDVEKQGAITGGDGTLKGNNTAGAIVVGSAKMMMNGGRIIQNIGSLGGAIFIDGGSFTMTGGSISGNTAAGGGGLYVKNGTAVMQGGSISGNSTQYAGSGVCVYSGSIFKMLGGSITGNKVVGATFEEQGGAVYVIGSTLIVGGSAKIADNTQKGSHYSQTLSASNIFFANYSDLMTISKEVPLTKGAAFGVRTRENMFDGGTFSVTGQNDDDYSSYFFSDSSNYQVFNDENNVLQLGKKDPVAPTITTTSLPNGKVGAAYAQTLVASGYPSPTWSLKSGTLPAGLTLGADGKISGTPIMAGKSTFTVLARNGSGSDTKELSITVETVLSVQLPAGAASLDFGSVLDGYEALEAKTVTVTNNGTDSVTLAQPASESYIIGTITKTTLANGESATFTVVPKTGLAAGKYNTSVAIQSGSYTYGSVALAFTVQARTPAAPKITTESLSAGEVGDPFAETLTATGYPVPTWSIATGALPAGLTLAADGKISGTPAASGVFTFTVKATNASGSDTKQLILTISSPVTSVSISPAATTVKKTKTQQFTAVAQGITDQTFTWSLEGATNSSISTSGLLTVGGRESAEAFIVIATSTVDSSKVARAAVTVALAPKVCTVTFQSDGGSAVPAISGIEEGLTIQLPNNPQKENCRFDGWYTQKNGGGQAFTSNTPVTDSMTVYAKWTKMVTLKGTVVEESTETPVSGATVTLSPTYGTTGVVTDEQGEFSFGVVPQDYFTVTAAFTDGSSVMANVTGDYGNIKITKPKPRLAITTQPQDTYIIRGIAGQSATFTVQGQRTPALADSVAYEWWWLKDATPSGQNPDVKMEGSGSQMTINQSNGNLPDRGTYQLYALAYSSDGVPLQAISRVASLKVVGVNTIEGTVLNKGKLVENAKVELVYAGDTWPYGSTAMTSSQNAQTTGADGAYRFELVPDGKYTLVITLPNSGGVVNCGPLDFPKQNPEKPVDIVVPDSAQIQISGQPQDVTVKNGTAASLSVAAVTTDNTPLTYQWYKTVKNDNQGGFAILGATDKAYSPATSEKGTYYYYCTVSAGSLNAVTTRAARVTVFTYGVIQGTVQTKDKQPIKGAEVTLINLDSPVKTGFTTSQNPQTTLANGKYRFEEVPDGTYQLQIKLPGGEKVEVQPITVPTVVPDIPVIPPEKPTISITKQPESVTVALNDTAQFAVGAGASNGGTVLYQWYSNKANSNKGGKAVEGAVEAVYRAPTTAKGVTYYYCVMQAAGADMVTSTTARLTVRNTPVNNLITVEGDVLDAGGQKVENAVVTLAPSAGTSQNPQTTKADGHYKFENLPDGLYTVTVQLPGGGEVDKKIVIEDGKITPTPPSDIEVPAENRITITQQPQDATITTGMAANFTVKASATKAAVTYQWYQSTTGAAGSGAKLEGKTEETLTLGQQPEGQSYYYCVVSSGNAISVSTVAAKLVVTKAKGNNGDVNGNVIEDDNGKKVKDATVRLMKNGTDGIQFGPALTTGSDGMFEFQNIPYGSYSLVAQKGSSTVTRQITVKAASATENLVMASGAKVTKVVVQGSKTPSAAVENLEAMFTSTDNTIARQPGATVEIKLVVQQQDDPADKSSIAVALGDHQKVGLYLDAKLVKTINGSVLNDGTQTIQPTSNQALRIVLDLPLELQGKAGYQILRSHTENGVTDVRTITPEYDAVLQTLSFDADVFSTYAVAYTKPQQYTATVVGSEAGASTGTGLYEAGTSVTVAAGAKTGFTFAGWASSDGVDFANTHNATTTFMMPGKNVTVTATWVANSSDDSDPNNGGSSGSSSGNSSNGGGTGGGSSSGPSSSSGSTKVKDKKPSGTSSSSSSKNSTGGSSSNSTGKNDDAKDLNKEKDLGLQKIADARQQAIDALPESLPDKERKEALDKIDQIYTKAVTSLKDANSAQAIADSIAQAASGFDAVTSAAGGSMAGQPAKPFVLLSLLLAFAAVTAAVLCVLQKRSRKKQGLAAGAALLAVVIFVLTSGLQGFAVANWWTVAIGALAVIAAATFLPKNSKEAGPN